MIIITADKAARHSSQMLRKAAKHNSAAQ